MMGTAPRSKRFRHGMVMVAMLAAMCGAARASDWFPPFPTCPTYPLTHVPMWSILTNAGYLCFVGQPPVQPSTTTFLTPLVPIIVKLKASDGSVEFVSDPRKPLFVNPTNNDSLSAWDAALGSPIFNTHDYKLGSTKLGTLQWGEMTEKASFWKYPGANFDNWFVELAVFPGLPETLEVPSGSWSGVAGEAHGYAVDAAVMDPFLKKLAEKTPLATPIFLTYNIGTYSIGQNQTPQCCAYGYHKAYVEDYYTNFYIWASYMDPPSGRPDVLGLSHEVAEFMHDPFLTNFVQQYPNPGSFKLPWNPPYTFTNCKYDLEVADPLEDRLGEPSEAQIKIKNSIMEYHLQNVVTASWLMQANPSFSVNGWYTLKGAVDGEFAAPAPLCSTTP
jgi:hypothetical protein